MTVGSAELGRDDLVSDLLDTPDVSARLQRLAREGLDDEPGLTWLLERAAELVHAQPAAAGELCTLCDAAARTQGLSLVSAQALYLRARVLAERGELQDSLTLIEQAHDLWRDAGQHVLALRTVLGTMQILDDLGRHDDALARGEEALAGLAALAAEGVEADPDDAELRQWLQAAVEENIGVACGFLGDHERALEAYRRSEGAYGALGLEDETARPMANRGIELITLGRGREALEVLGAAAEVFEGSGDRLWSAKCLGHVAQAHQQLGELLAALQALGPARDTLHQLGAEVEAARLQLAAADLYLSIGLTQEARTEATEAVDRTTSAGLRHDTASAHFVVALAEMDMGNLEEGGTNLRAAHRIFEEVGDRHQCARAQLALAELLRREERLDEGVRMATVAADALREGDWPVSLAAAELWLAETAPDHRQAQAHLDSLERLPSVLRLPQVREPYLMGRARLLRARGRPTEAVAILHSVIDEIDHGRRRLADASLRRAFFSRRLAAYDELVDLLVDRGEPDDLEAALRLSDRAKARTLTELVHGTLGRPTPPTMTDAQEPTSRAALETDLNAVHGELMSVADPMLITALRRRAESLEQQIGMHLAREAHHRVAANETSGPQSADTPTWPERLLSYHVVGDDVVGFALQHGVLNVHRLTGVLPRVRAELDQLTAQWSRFQLGGSFTRRTGPLLLATSEDILGTLHDLLVRPLAHHLTGADGDPLVVVAPRALLEVPFHALHDGSRPLVERWSITLAPTAGGSRAHAGPTGQRPVVLAVPDSRAPAVEAEALAVAEVLPGARVLIGDAATADAFVAAVPGADLLHIACHGLYRPENPLFSSVQLADRAVTASEILELDLRGALVILSACDSGRQGGLATEPVGLAWAFLAAGASGLVVSQWVVDDAVTSDLMVSFHHHLAGGVDPAAALRLAQRTTRETATHPYFWAPFSYVAAPVATRTETS